MGAVTEARAALARCDWATAYTAANRSALDDPLDEAERLDVLGEALWWLGRIDECIEARQAAYGLFEQHGESRRAAQTAIWLYEHHGFKGRTAMGGGWLGRARRALAGDDECETWGHLLLREAEVAHGRGELDHAVDNATAALELARRLRSTNLEGEALQTIGRVLIDAGRPSEGLAHLDEAMLLAVEGRLTPYATGKVYCSLIGACEELGDLARAAEWTDATLAWSMQHQFAVFPGLCRVKRAEVLQWRGEWVEAEREARQACDELKDIKIGSAAAAWAEVGDIRRRTGDLVGAEEAFAQSEALGGSPPPGLALLRLAQGRVDAATTIVETLLDGAGWNRLARARLLPARVQVALAAGDAATATAASDELDRIADDYATPGLVAAARTARGRVLLAEGDRAACATLRRAVDAWRRLDAPYEVATAEVLLGHACRLVGDVEGETRSLASADAAFRQLGAAVPATPSAARTLPGGLTEREAEVLRLVADGRTNKDIAAHLGLSQKTVARHLSNIFVKTGVTSRAGATAFAFENGIVGSRT